MASKYPEFEDDHKPEMTDNTEDFQFAQFAKEKFQADESPYSSRDVLKHPLLQLKERKHQRMALRIWVVLLRLMVWLQEPRYLALMEEYKATHVSNWVTDPPMSDIQMIQYIIMYGTRTPNLRDEIYCQLCKQLTKNSDNQSYLKVWELLCLCVGCFPPSGNLVNYLRNFIKWGPSDYAPYCEQRLQRTIKKGSRLNPPGTFEFQATKSKKPLMLTVKFPDGTTLTVSSDSATTARDLCLHIAKQISLVDQFGFMLDLHYCNKACRLDSGDRVMDEISYMELQAVLRNENPDVTSCYLVFRKHIFAPWQILSDDPVATNLIYKQVVDRVKSRRFGYDKDDDLVRLTTKQNVNDPKVKEDIVRYVRNKLTMSFSMFWGVSKVAGPSLQKGTAKIVVNSTGLFVVDTLLNIINWNGDYFIKLSFPEILSILSNRTDDMPWFKVIVTIQTVIGDQYTFTALSTQAEELKYIVETIQTPPSKQDHSQEGTTDLDDVNIAGMSRMKITAGDVMQARKAPTNWKKGPLLGVGAFGKVHKCYDKDTGHEYAVKMVKLGSLKEANALVIEIKMLRNLQHERIVQYFGFQNDGKVLSIFVEYMSGGSVRNLINEIGEIQESLVKKYLRQVLLGLAYLHEKAIVHRDIKAANVLRDTLGNVKLGDFGSSKHLQSSSFVGTPHYMAPEVINQEVYDSKADIWSLGCTVVEMLCSKPPFHDLKPSDVIVQVLKCEHPDYELPHAVSSLANEFLALTFQKIPADRPSAENLLKHRFAIEEVAVPVNDTSLGSDELHVDANEEGPVASDDVITKLLKNVQPGSSVSVAGNVGSINLVPSQTSNPAIDNLYNRTDTELDEELIFDVTDSNALKSVKYVLEDYRVALLVGSSPILKKTIGLSILRDYREMRFNVLSLSSLSDNDTAAIMDGCEKCVFLDEVFGLITLNENRFDKVFDILTKIDRNNRLFFTLTPLAFHTCQNRLKTLLPDLKKLVINLDDRYEFDLATKSKILSKINRLRLSESKIEELSEEDNPVFLECCNEYLKYKRFDRDINQLFLQPMDCLVKEIMCLKEEWQRGYQVLVLVALCPEFSFSVKYFPKVMSKYMELFHHDFELGEVYTICEKFIDSYLRNDFQFKYEMYRNAILGTIDDKEFLLANCPISFISSMDAIFVKNDFYRGEHFSFHLSLLARRFVKAGEDDFSKLTNLNVWHSIEFKKIYGEESKRHRASRNDLLNSRLRFLLVLAFVSVCIWILNQMCTWL